MPPELWPSDRSEEELLARVVGRAGQIRKRRRAERLGAVAGASTLLVLALVLTSVSGGFGSANSGHQRTALGRTANPAPVAPNGPRAGSESGSTPSVSTSRTMPSASVPTTSGKVPSASPAVPPVTSVTTTGKVPSAIPAAPPDSPLVTSVSPSNGPLVGGTTVTLTGDDLAGTTSVLFFGAPAEQFRVVSNSTIVAVTPAVRYPGGSTAVAAYNANGQGRTWPGGCTTSSCCSHFFTYWAPPKVTGISPTRGPSFGGTTVDIYGGNNLDFAPPGCASFTGAVYFGKIQATDVTVVNGSELRATAPPGSVGQVDVEVVDPGGRSEPSSNDQFTYV
jgi:hypothetical protein